MSSWLSIALFIHFQQQTCQLAAAKYSQVRSQKTNLYQQHTNHLFLWLSHLMVADTSVHPPKSSLHLNIYSVYISSLRQIFRDTPSTHTHRFFNTFKNGKHYYGLAEWWIIDGLLRDSHLCFQCTSSWLIFYEIIYENCSPDVKVQTFADQHLHVTTFAPICIAHSRSPVQYHYVMMASGGRPSSNDKREWCSNITLFENPFSLFSQKGKPFSAHQLHHCFCLHQQWNPINRTVSLGLRCPLWMLS